MTTTIKLGLLFSLCLAASALTGCAAETETPAPEQVEVELARRTGRPALPDTLGDADERTAERKDDGIPVLMASPLPEPPKTIVPLARESNKQ